jgi:hypothetical protein
MQAELETMKWPVPKPEFCTRENGVTMGERTERKRGKIKHEHGRSLYADDEVFLLNTRDVIFTFIYFSFFIRFIAHRRTTVFKD